MLEPAFREFAAELAAATRAAGGSTVTGTTLLSYVIPALVHEAWTSAGNPDVLVGAAADGMATDPSRVP